MPNPTRDQFDAYLETFTHFNKALFMGKLPPAMLRFTRRTDCMAYYAPKAWQTRSGIRVAVISLNPDHFYLPPIETMSTLVHEMVHHWQYVFGSPSRTVSHDHQWADKMDSLGLVPSHTGRPGGERVGRGVSHYIIEGEAFDRAFGKMRASVRRSWASVMTVEAGRDARQREMPETGGGAGNRFFHPNKGSRHFFGFLHLFGALGTGGLGV
jgi:hypothetical protein